MASKHQMTGMLGVYLAAAELTHKDLIVSITSRNARGADILATDQSYKKAWSIQVKTNRKPAGFWLLSQDYKENVSPTHLYIFINLRQDKRPDYYVVPSREVAKNGRTTRRNNSLWHAYDRYYAKDHHEGWGIFTKAKMKRPKR